ncbi:MAG: DUF294 nucleotidyltransferase-like domain-containing protein, partial [Desulfuromonadaceae bacterium]|nr:DUF294 nucleotidyltransferase-like domain-containing protein [Desulfuromonadaceae bacterium]
MPHNAINEESLFFIRIEKLSKGPAVTCTPDQDAVEVTRIMQEHDSTGLIVVEDGLPVGTFTIRDLRKLISDTGGAIIGRKIRDIMGRGLITVRLHDYVYDAIFKMAMHNIHRLGVVNEEGKLVGVLTDTDLLRIQTRTPLYLLQKIEAAESIDQLKKISRQIMDVVTFASQAGADIISLVQLISQFNDAVTHRLISLLESIEGIALPEGAAYLALGSEGRSEQTLRTDQDSAIVYRDDLTEERLREVERFAIRIADALDEIGVPRCPGNSMASNPEWRHSLSEWKQILDQWMTIPSSENMVKFGMFQDLRALHGDKTLEKELHDQILAEAAHNSIFLFNIARNVCRFPPPLG